MAYSKSSARRQLEGRIFDLLTSAKVADVIPQARAHQLALQGAVIQIHAAFEEYVSDFIEDWCYAHALSQQSATLVPDATRKWLLHKYQESYYASFLVTRNDSKLLAALDFNQPVFATLINQQAYLRIASSSLIGDKGYPSLDNLQTLFRRFGIENLRAYLGRKLGQSADEYFRNFATLRITIAHRTAGPIVLRDVRQFGARARRIVLLLDNAFYESLCVSTGSTVWR